MKIFYFGHFAGFDGYSRTARDYVRLLVEQGHDVTIRTIDGHEHFKTNNKLDIIELAEKTVETDFDIAIVHKSPWNQENQTEAIHEWAPFKNAKKKIWITVFETSKWPKQWCKPLSHFNEIWVPSKWQMEAAYAMFEECYPKYKNGIEIERFFPARSSIKLIPHVVECRPAKPNETDIYTFYSEFSRVTHRKGLDILLKAYYNAFSADDKVILKIKISNQDITINNYHKELEHAKNCFKWKELPKIDLCQAWLSDQQMETLYDCVDCYICSSRGEGFCVPLATAAVKGLNIIFPICIDQNKHKSWVDYYKDYSCKAEFVNIITDEFWQHKMIIDTSQMKWMEMDIDILSEEMTALYKITEKPKINHNAKDYLSKSSVYAKIESSLTIE